MACASFAVAQYNGFCHVDGAYGDGGGCGGDASLDADGAAFGWWCPLVFGACGGLVFACGHGGSSFLLVVFYHLPFNCAVAVQRGFGCEAGGVFAGGEVGCTAGGDAAGLMDGGGISGAAVRSGSISFMVDA